MEDWPLILKEKIAAVKEEHPEIDNYSRFCQHYFPGVSFKAALSWFSSKGIAIRGLFKNVTVDFVQVKDSETILRKRMFPFEQASADTYDSRLTIKKLILNNREPLRTSYEKFSLFSIPPFPELNPASSSSNRDFIETAGEKDDSESYAL